jgi:hypothetical protein
MATGDPRKIMNLRLRFPEFTKGMKDAFDAMDEDQRRRDLTQIGTIYARAQAGDTTGAAGVLRNRIEADKAAGEADPQDEAILAELESGDPTRVRAAVATIGIQLSAVEPDKFSETYGRLNPTEATPATMREYDARVAKFGKAAADNWLRTQDTKTVAVNPGGTVFQLGGDTVPQGGMPATQGGGDPSGSGASIPATGAAIERAALSVVPGAIVTSGKRSREKNAAVGGAPNSYHLTDQARDFVPPKGMSMGQLASQLRAAMPGFDVINEGDHVHVEPAGSKRAAGPVQVKSKQQYDRLPVGAAYIAPDGTQRVKS